VRRLILILCAAAVTAAILAPSAVAAERKVPFGFLGAMADGPLVDETSLPIDAEVKAMVRTGVERLRLAVYWNQAQPSPTAPPDFAATDRIVAAAARRGIRVLVTIVGAPPWARKSPTRTWSPPADPAAYGRFAGEVAARFGSRGTFWTEHPALPRIPVRDYQIWNEPAGFAPGQASVFWDDSTEPYQQRYVAMLRASRREIRAADPRASIVLAALFGRSWQTLPDIIAAGAGGLFDQYALNVFTARTSDAVLVGRLTRKAMLDAGAPPVPMLYTELAWTASRGELVKGSDNRDYDLTPKTQSRRLAAGLTKLVAARRELQLRGVFWYTWMTRYASRVSRFDYTGLRKYGVNGRVRVMPAQRAYRRVARRLEGCRKVAIRDC